VPSITGPKLYSLSGKTADGDSRVSFWVSEYELAENRTQSVKITAAYGLNFIN